MTFVPLGMPKPASGVWPSARDNPVVAGSCSPLAPLHDLIILYNGETGNKTTRTQHVSCAEQPRCIQRLGEI